MTFQRRDFLKLGATTGAVAVLGGCATAAKNPDGSIVVVLLNQSTESFSFSLELGEKSTDLIISAKAIQTIVL